MLRPLEDRIVVDPDRAVERTSFGLYLPEAARRPPQVGRVVAVGPGIWAGGRRVPLDVQVGDKVLYSKYGHTETRQWYHYERDGHLIFSMRDVLAVVPSHANEPTGRTERNPDGPPPP
jgi:chaperonin GroES